MTLGSMRKAVFAQKPVFKRILTQYGDISLAAYFKALGADYTPLNVPRGRRREVIAAITARGKKLLGKQAAIALARYFKKRYVVSTAAHHDFATHPFFANYLIAAGYANKDADLTAIPVLSCAGISLNNSSFPRGLLFHDAALTEQRLKVVSLRNHQHPVYDYPGYTVTSLPQSTEPDIQHFITNILGGSALRYPQLTDQITVAVHALSKSLPGLAEAETVYLPQEEIAVTLFLKHHLKSKTIISRIVFDPHVRGLFIEKFKGIIGTHDDYTQTGSHLFWGLSDSNRVSLRIQKNRLTSEDGRVSISLTPNAIREALMSKKIMPTMGFTLTLLSFYYGLACAGGFSQVNYLTEMKAAYLELLKELPTLKTESAIATAVPTDLFAGEFVLATLGAKRVAATALDIILKPKHFNEARLRQLMKKTTLQAATDKMMPELYKIIVSS